MRVRPGAALMLGLAAFAAIPARAQDAPQAQSWDFAATLDGKPIGAHSFRLTPESGDGWRMDGEANFAVRLLGIVVYRYHHTVVEHWRDGCLASLSSDTDNDGVLSHVAAAATPAGGTVTRTNSERGSSRESWTGCLMSFAYWNPKLREQTRLLNPQTGEIENVTIAPVGTAGLVAQGRTVSAQSWRIAGRNQPVDVWYTPSGDWVGLDAQVRGGRVLSYRLP
jgi:hypothetical protein